jgi:hypothetical protein
MLLLCRCFPANMASVTIKVKPYPLPSRKEASCRARQGTEMGEFPLRGSSESSAAAPRSWLGIVQRNDKGSQWSQVTKSRINTNAQGNTFRFFF